ncbi:hypothetical protein LNN31_11100 [Acetobacterium wieringae]|uniref:O-antigen ligase family protein n=1 Tax=Acetobacterium wieringae TaxID=52694 RepID=A0ABY6HA16_9FIRM|nr:MULTISPECIES: hypothetical protein [Acetobacterium]OXS25475.1 MAG: hypothetical protein BI182_09860 [Acetobacterium sp. MES1]URN82956.1 hypothetical protein CHL1_002059 [Acetobacterium wieringae]UYO61334.1 hypothetical protein LNN31_11100 [Acetobacterium wieringae]VUZ28773.1 Uncharacterised protein [Acetobacterium wieringae]
MITRKSTNSIAILGLALLLIILGLSNTVFLIIGIMIASSYIFLSGAEGIYGLYFMLPFSPIMKFAPGGNTFFNVLIAVYILRMIFLNPKTKISLYQILSILALIIFSLLNTMDSSLIKLVELVIYFVLAFLVMNNKDDIEVRKLLMYFIAGIIIASILGSFSDLIPGLSGFMQETRIKLEDGDVFGRFSGIQTNPNFYTMDITIAIAALLYMIGMKKHRWYDYVLVIILLGFGILSLSLSFMLAVGVIFILYLAFKIVQLTKLSFDVNVVLRGIFFIALTLLIISEISSLPYMNIYFQRLGVGSFLDQSLSDLTTGRSDIWSDYLSLYLSDWRIFLVGVGYSVEAYHLRQAHNYFLELLVHLGIIGTILYFNVLNSIFKPFSMKVKGRMLCLLPLVALIFRGFGINLFFRENFIFYLIICALIMADDDRIDDLKTPRKEVSDEK